MTVTRDQLYAEICDFLGEKQVTPDSNGLAQRILAAELPAAELVLSLHPYNFASQTKRLQLDATANPADPESDPIGWGYAFKKGAVLRVNYVTPTGRLIDRLTRGGDWDDKGGRILANVSVLYLDGVQGVFATQEKMGYWPRLVGSAIASVIADRLGKPVTNSRGTAADISARSAALIEAAETWDANQAPGPPKRTGNWNKSRRRGAAFSTGEL